MTQEKKDNITFEKSFARLENILEALNDNKLSLDASLTLFEEANGLITNCDQYLVAAENKIEKLIKDRNSKIVVDEENIPMTEELDISEKNIFSSPHEDATV